MLTEKYDCKFCNCDWRTCSRHTEKAIMIKINNTFRCDSNCEYCYNKFNGNHKGDMEKVHIDKLFNYIDDTFDKEYGIQLYFIGGEPSLRTDIIDYALDKFYKSGRKFFTRINTNAKTSIFENGLYELKQKYTNVKLQVSIPHKSEYDYEDKERNIIREMIPLQSKLGIIFNLVYYHDEVDTLLSEIKYWHELGVNHFYVSPIFKDSTVEVTDDILDKTIEEYKRVVEYYKSRNMWNLKISPLTDNLDRPYKLDRQFRMRFDDRRHIIFDYYPDGKFYMTHQYENDSIGNPDDGLYLHTMKFIYDSTPCAKCDYNIRCGMNIFPFYRDNKVIENPTFCKLNKVRAGYLRKEFFNED